MKMAIRSIKSSSILLVLLSMSAACTEWNGFLGKFTKCLFFCSNGFFDMPVTKEEALKSSPAYVDTGYQDPDFALNIFCLKDDPHVCMLFDINGKIGGIRVSHLKKEVADDLSKFPYKYDDIATFNSTTFMGQDLWYTNFLFTKPDNLKQGGPGRLNTEETAEGLWVKLSTGWVEVPRDECQAQLAGWQKQGFIPWMGNHYTYGQTDDCSVFIPLLPIYHKGRLVALALAPFGKHSVVQRDWFEDVPYDVIKKIVPHGYKPCLEDWVQQYRDSGFHFYFVKYPRLILWDQSPSCQSK